MTSRLVTRTDIVSMTEYGARRRALRRELSALREKRRVEVGPFVTFSFECYQTIWHQIHEMLFIEKGGEAQIDEELEAYNPLIPNGSDLVATMMIEIEEPVRRDRELSRLGGIDTTVAFRLGGSVVRGKPEGDIERTREDGKTSSVHFLHFPFDVAQIAAFRTPGAEVILAIDHQHYRHMAVLPEEVRERLAADFG